MKLTHFQPPKQRQRNARSQTIQLKENSPTVCELNLLSSKKNNYITQNRGFMLIWGYLFEADSVQAYERAESSLVEEYNRVEKYVFTVCPKGLADILYSCETSRKRSGFVI